MVLGMVLTLGAAMLTGCGQNPAGPETSKAYSSTHTVTYKIIGGSAEVQYTDGFNSSGPVVVLDGWQYNVPCSYNTKMQNFSVYIVGAETPEHITDTITAQILFDGVVAKQVSVKGHEQGSCYIVIPAYTLSPR